MKFNWLENGLRCTRDDNRRPWITGQFWAGKDIDELKAEKGFLCKHDFRKAEKAQKVVDRFLWKMVYGLATNAWHKEWDYEKE